jgi:hypothetical protein
MAQPAGAPMCAASHQHRGALWRRMLKINHAHRRKRGQGPITAAMQVVYDYLLWKCPRGLGVLIPAKRTISTATGVSLATVKRAVTTLSRWGLLLVQRRQLRGHKPVRIGNRVHLLRVAMTTSNAYTFPANLPEIWGAQTDPVEESLSKREDKQRDNSGRWVPAATAAMIQRLKEKWFS